jgi:hypothetical protein
MRKRLLVIPAVAALAASLLRVRSARQRVEPSGTIDTEAFRARMERAREDLLRR